MTEDKKTNVSIPLSGCFYVILLGALCVIAIKECKRADMRYERDKILHQRFMDSINAKPTNTNYVLYQQKTK